MNSNARYPTQRQNSAAILSPVSKSTFSIEEWEKYAALDEVELKSISDLQGAFIARPLPSHETPAYPSRSSTPLTRQKATLSVSRPGTPKSGSTSGQNRTLTSKLFPQEPVQTPQQFHEWFDVVDRSIAHNLETQFRSQSDLVSGYLDTCNNVVDNIDDIQMQLKSMLKEWNDVDLQGKTLKDACERLLKERDDVLQLRDEIDTRLLYFQELDYATRFLNHPGDTLVLQAEFLDAVERIDVCIMFLRSHREYRECDIYLLRFQQCLTRAMTLIRFHIINALKSLTMDTVKRLSDKDISQTAQMHLLYTRFQSLAVKIAPLVAELERRTAAHPNEMSSLLNECQEAYFAARRSLLTDRLLEEMRGLNPSDSELVGLTRSGCTYLRQLCMDEFSLYRMFFSTGKERLYTYLEGLCDYLYDDLRPRILHEPRLTVLCDVCAVLQALIIVDTDMGSSVDGEEEFRSAGSDSLNKVDGMDHLSIRYLLQSILQDAQTRLFFRAQSMVHSDIRHYPPKGNDLEYPAKLANKTHSLRKNYADDEAGSALLADLIAEQETWYPAFTNLVRLLRQLHNLIQPLIFSDIALEGIDFCRLALLSASENITKSDIAMPELNSLLFLIRHLLILKKIISNLELVPNNTSDSIDLPSSVTSTSLDQVESASLMPSIITASFITGDVTQTADAAKNVDVELKGACEKVIDLSASTATSSLQKALTAKIGALDTNPSTQDREGVSSIRQNALSADKTFRGSLRNIILSLLSAFKLYLENEGTVSALISHVQEKIIDTYSIFRNSVSAACGLDILQSFLTLEELKGILHDICYPNIAT